MNQEMIRAYTARISQANRSQLTVILFDIMLDCFSSARKSAPGEARTYLRKSREFLNELMGSLDYQYPISFELMSLYMYSDKRIVKAMVEGDMDVLTVVEHIFTKLRSSFETISEEDHSQGVMANAETIYAGLTYGKDSLNEAVMSGKGKRGFEA